MWQTRPVRLVNLVSKGSVEQGMLPLPAFKRSLSAGVLDGGVGEVQHGGSRVNRFIQGVDNFTGRAA